MDLSRGWMSRLLLITYKFHHKLGRSRSDGSPKAIPALDQHTCCFRFTSFSLNHFSPRHAVSIIKRLVEAIFGRLFTSKAESEYLEVLKRSLVHEKKASWWELFQLTLFTLRLYCYRSLARPKFGPCFWCRDLVTWNKSAFLPLPNTYRHSSILITCIYPLPPQWKMVFICASNSNITLELRVATTVKWRK